MTASHVGDCIGAAPLLDDLPTAKWLLGDRGHYADWFSDALEAKGIQPCIPGRRSRNELSCTTSADTNVAAAATLIFWLYPMNPDPKQIVASGFVPKTVSSN